MNLRTVLSLIALCIAVWSIGLAEENSPPAREFAQHVNEYLGLKGKQKVPSKQTGSSAELAQQKQETISKIRQARATAKQGDIFTPAVCEYFKHQIQATLRGAKGQQVMASLRHAEPTPALQLHVNDRYPPDLPLQSTPPTLLLNLPQLPDGLQYRLVGSSLVLYDVNSDLIIDYIPNAIPGAPTKKK